MKRQQGGPEGLLLVDKPAGWTSHDVVAKVRRLAGQRRTGHTGTLDPAATGLLVLCLGRATRLVEYMAGHGKAYSGVIKLGERTNTDDAEGEVLERRGVPQIDRARLDELETAFSGEIQQVPPAYSAIKVSGQPAHRAARKGVALELRARRVTIHELRLDAVAADELTIEAACSAGTYIRSLARDIGEALGCGAHLASLRRTRVGAFGVEDGWTIEELEAVLPRHIDEVLLAADEALTGMNAALLPAAIEAETAVVTEGARHDVALRIYDSEGRFVGVGEVARAGRLRPVKVFAPPLGLPQGPP